MVVDDSGEQQYEWCSQESDEDSAYGAEVGDHGSVSHFDSSKRQAAGSSILTSQIDDVKAAATSNYLDQLNFIHNTLQPPSNLSPSFKRFFSEFEHNIDFILRNDYEILP